MCWEPSHRMEWLGFCIDLTLGEFSVPVQKILAFKAKLSEIRKERTLPAKKLTSLVGKIISMSPALGAITRLMTHSLCVILNSRTAWCHQVALTDEPFCKKLNFGLWEYQTLMDKKFGQSPSSAVRVVYFDASSTGYGGYVVEHGNLVANGPQKIARKAQHGENWKHYDWY